MRSTVPQEMWGAIADKLFVTGPPRGQERLEHRGGRRIDGVVKHCPPRAQFVTVTLPYSMERSTFVVLASSVLFLVYWQWRTMPAVVWDVTSPAGRLALHVLFWFGWAIALAATFMINHLDLFGLRQVYLAWRGQPYTDLGFRTFLLCRLVRHPLMLGFIIAFWATPTMTAGHLPYAIATTGYILIAVQLEERDLVAALGNQYRDYQRRVAMLIPWPRRRREPEMVPAEVSSS